MKYALVSDIMYVKVGEHGPIWASTEEILDSMEFAKQNGMTGVEFWWWEDRDVDAIANKAAELGLEIPAICAKGTALLGCPDKLEEMEAGLRETIPVAQRFGAAVIYNGDDYPKDAPREIVHQAMVDGLRRLAPLAEQAGVTILLEPTSGGYFQNSDEAFAILDEVGSPNVKLLYDIFHFQMIEGHILPTLQAHLGQIGHIHGAGAPMRCELTVGETNYPFLLRALKEMNYDGWFGLEFFTFENREEKVAASCGILI